MNENTNPENTFKALFAKHRLPDCHMSKDVAIYLRALLDVIFLCGQKECPTAQTIAHSLLCDTVAREMFYAYRAGVRAPEGDTYYPVSLLLDVNYPQEVGASRVALVQRIANKYDSFVAINNPYA